MSTNASPIPTRTFPSSGVEVGCVGYGAMSLAGMVGEPVAQEQVDAILLRCIEQGVTVIDTSDIYTVWSTKQLGHGERQIGSFLKRHPEARAKLFICTKFCIRYVDGERVMDGSAQWCEEAAQASLERLGVDYIDLYYCHRYDGKTDPRETAAAMKKLKDAGKIKHVGVSEFPMDKLQAFNEVCHVDAIQNEFSPWTPDVLKLGIFDWCEKNKTMYVSYAPLGKGILTGAIKKPEDMNAMHQALNSPRASGENFHKNRELVDKIEAIATERGAKPGHVTLAWALATSPVILPIPGTTKLVNLDDNLQGARLQLTRDEVDRITDIVSSFTMLGNRYAGDVGKTMSHE